MTDDQRKSPLKCVLSAQVRQGPSAFNKLCAQHTGRVTVSNIRTKEQIYTEYERRQPERHSTLWCRLSINSVSVDSVQYRTQAGQTRRLHYDAVYKNNHCMMRQSHDYSRGGWANVSRIDKMCERRSLATLMPSRTRRPGQTHALDGQHQVASGRFVSRLRWPRSAKVLFLFRLSSSCLVSLFCWPTSVRVRVIASAGER